MHLHVHPIVFEPILHPLIIQHHVYMINMTSSVYSILPELILALALALLLSGQQ
jgi:hypothetical protein